MSLKNNKLRKHEKYYSPRNLEKYVGQYPIVCRSSWEYRYCEWLDANPSVLEWSSESHCIRYIDPLQMKKTRRYYPDYYVCFKTPQGKKRFIVEVKPDKETKPPPKKSKASAKTKQIWMQTYLINKAKFEAAREYSRKMGFEFRVLTEKQLFRDKRG
jgi:hypothetical protein